MCASTLGVGRSGVNRSPSQRVDESGLRSERQESMTLGDLEVGDGDPGRDPGLMDRTRVAGVVGRHEDEPDAGERRQRVEAVRVPLLYGLADGYR